VLVSLEAHGCAGSHIRGEAIAFCRHTDTRHLLDQIPLLKQLEATAHQKYDAQRREAAARGMESTLGVATVCVDRTASRHSRKAPQVEVAIGVQSQL
jgi:hypothetical protein